MHAPTTTQTSTANGWLWNSLMDGLSKLLTLSLDRQPASDLIEGTAATWHLALIRNREWIEKQDAPRIEAAFYSLAANSRTWPSPRSFLDALPDLPRVYSVATKRIQSEANSARAAGAFEEIASKLRISAIAAGKAQVAKDRQRVDDIAEQLHMRAVLTGLDLADKSPLPDLDGVQTA